MRKKSNEVNAGLKPLNDVRFRGEGVTSKALLAALLLGITPAMAAELADVDLSKIPLNKPTLDYLHENNVQIPQTEYDDEGNLIESGFILAPESAYTLTEVPAGADGAAPTGDNIITKFEYNASDGSFTPKYYQLNLKQTTYGEGNQSYSVTLENSPVKDVIINVLYDNTNTSERITVDSGTDYGDITSNFIGNSADEYGGAIYNVGTIGNITGNFIRNSVNGSYSYGGAIYNDGGTIGNITGDFIGNSSGRGGGAISNDGGSTIKDITGDFIGNSSGRSGGAIDNDDSTIGNITGDFIGNSAYSPGGAIYNRGTIGDITGDFIGNSARGNGDGGAIYNIGYIGDITGDFIGNYADDDGGAIVNSYGTIGNITGDFIGNYAEAGGAIYNSEGTIGNITGNFIANSGRAIVNSFGHINSIQGNFYNNTGGAIDSGYIFGMLPENSDEIILNNILNSEFYNNSASTGGAILFSTSYARSMPVATTILPSYINNSIFKNNTAIMGGGAIAYSKRLSNDGIAISLSNDVNTYNYDTANSRAYDLEINNSIFSNNIANSINQGGHSVYGGAISFDGYNENTVRNNGNSHGSTYIEYDVTQVVLVDDNGNKIADIGSYLWVSDAQLGTAGTSSTDPMHNIIRDSYFENNKAISDYNALGGAISVSSTGSATVGTEVIIDKYEHVSEQTIDYYLEWLPMPDPDMTQEEYIQYIKDELQSDIESDPNMFATEEELYAALESMGIDPNGSASGTSHDSLEIVNTSFVNNSAETVKNGDAYGGAIFSQTNLKITADNGTSLFDGNKVINNGVEENQAIFMNNINPDKTPLRLTLEAKNTGVIQINDKIAGSTEYIDNLDSSLPRSIPSKEPAISAPPQSVYKLNITGDETGKVILNNDIKAYSFKRNGEEYDLIDAPVDISLEKTNLYLGARDDVLNGNNLDLKSGLFSMSNNSVGTASLNTFTISGDTNFVADVNLQDQTMDRITADSYGAHTGNLNVVGMNILNDAPVGRDTTEIFFAETGLMDNVVNGTGELPDSNYQVALTPIYKYNVGYETREDDGGYFIFTRGDKIPTTPGGSTGGGSTGNPSDAFNPAVLATPVGNLAAGQAAMNEAFKYVFEHADAFTQLPAMERYAKINANKYALSTDFNENMPSYAEQLHNNAVWFRPYTTFETMNIKNGPKVDAITYGSLVGFDGDFKEMKNGWSRIFTGYAGYMGSSLNYSGVDTTMNGGLLGFTETFYKGNFWTAITASAGASVGESHTMYGKEDYTSLLAGVGSKTGYNFEFKDGKFIIQPIMFLSYTFVNTFDYKNAAGVSIESDPLHTIQLNPSVRFIANLKGGWQPYASVGMVWNLMNESKVTANNVKLPEMSVKPYVEYGVGVQRNWADKFTAFLQAMIRNGGRNGVALTGGFRFMLGSDSKNSDKPKVKKEIKSL